MGTGYDVYLWCGPEDVYLEVDDSTLILFNEHHTFESNLTLDESLIITDKTYRVLLKKDNEIIQVKNINKDSISEGGNLTLKFDPRRCCYSEDLKYVFFKRDSLSIANTYCSIEESILDYALATDNSIEIIGIKNDSVTDDEVKDRISFVQSFLISKGLRKSKIEIRPAFLDTNEFGNSNLRGSEYMVGYPKDNHKEEIGVILRRLN
jgi:hypothetical protein